MDRKEILTKQCNRHTMAHMIIDPSPEVNALAKSKKPFFIKHNKSEGIITIKTKNMRYWVVSPNVKNNAEENDWIKAILKTERAFIGWGIDNDKGKTFSNIGIGDLVLISKREKWKPKVIMCGIANSIAFFEKIEYTPGEAQNIKLIYCVKKEDLESLKLNFEGTAWYGDNKQIPAIYELHPENNSKDANLIEILLREITNIKKNEAMNFYVDILKKNKNLVLTGAPGTGKTYLAKQIAEALNAETEFVQFHPSYDYTDFVEGLRPVKNENSDLGFELKDGVFKSFCKKAIHNLADSKKSIVELSKEVGIGNKINDFLSSATENEIEYELKQGNSFSIIKYDENNIEISIPKNQITSTLNIKIGQIKRLLADNVEVNSVKDVCDYFGRTHNAQSDSYVFIIYKELMKNSGENKIISQQIEKKDYVIIIDEINRAEISKVFGELFFSIDSGYRGSDGKVKTQYANLQDSDDIFVDGFYVPENVYIIGTMNDIDRSVESFDFAMRRRFTWVEIKADDRTEMLDETIPDWKDIAIRKMQGINKVIESIEGLNSSYHIGPAYFLKLKDYEGDFSQLWQYHIEPLIKEYLRGLPNAINDLNTIREAFNNG